MPTFTITSASLAPPKSTRAAKWAWLEDKISALRAGECIVLEPEGDETRRAMRFGLAPVAKRHNLEVRNDPDGRRVWLIPKGPIPSAPREAARPLAANGRTPAPSAAGGSAP